MPSAYNMELDERISILMKGPYGFGKTLAAASFALAGPTYIAYFDKKKPIELMTYFTEKRFGSKAKTILNNITYDIYGASNANEYLNKTIQFVKNPGQYTTFITDSVTNLTGAIANWSLGFAKGSGAILRPDDERVVPDFDEFKVLTSFITQALDLQKLLPMNIIWTAHPLQGIKIEGSGASIRVTKTTPIVTYGNKVGSMIPGSFSEIYHFLQQQNWNDNTKKYICSLDAVGDDFAKSPLLSHKFKELDFSNRLFYDVWLEAYNIAIKDLKQTAPDDINGNGANAKENTKENNPFNQPKW